jgi:hypothetical protein
VQVLLKFVFIRDPALRADQALLHQALPLVQTLHLLVQTLHPLVQTLHPLVQILHLLVQTLHPLVQTLHPLVQTLHLLVQILHLLVQTLLLLVLGDVTTYLQTNNIPANNKPVGENVQRVSCKGSAVLLVADVHVLLRTTPVSTILP